MKCAKYIRACVKVFRIYEVIAIKGKYSVTALIVRCLMLFSILTVLQGINAFDDINKYAIALLAFVLLVRMCAYKYTSLQLGMLFTTIVLHIIALACTEFPLYNSNMLFYFFLWVVLYLFCRKSKDEIMEKLDKSVSFIRGVLWVWTIIVGVSVFLPSSYVDRYFLSFTGNSFRLMPATLIITALTIYMVVKTGNKNYNWFLLLPTYAAFMNFSRVYFGVYILFILMHIYMQVHRKRDFYILLLPICVIVLVLMSFSGIADKILATQHTDNSYYDFWATITNTRTIFWAEDLKAFFALPFLQQFVGNGFNFVYDVNQAAMNNAIWAHNDIINILMNFGYIGVVVYCWAYFQMARAFLPKESKVPLILRVLFHGAVFVNSMMNMSYTYLCAMISYPLLLCAIAKKYDTKRESSKS